MHYAALYCVMLFLNTLLGVLVFFKKREINYAPDQTLSASSHVQKYLALCRC